MSEDFGMVFTLCVELVEIHGLDHWYYAAHFEEFDDNVYLFSLNLVDNIAFERK